MDVAAADRTRERVTPSRGVHRRARSVAMAAIAAALLVATIGATEVLGQERRNRQRVRPAAATVTVSDSLALVTAVGFDGQGTLHESQRGEEDFTVFDEVAKFDDTDDRPRGAAARTEQESTVVGDGTTLVVASTSVSTARYYDRNTSDAAQPAAGGESDLSVAFDVAGGTGFFSLRGSIHGEGTGGGSTGCGSVVVTAPNGTSIQVNCAASSTIPVDESGPLDPGSYTLSIEGDTDTTQGHAAARARFTWDLRLVLSGCTIEGTANDDPDLDGTIGDDVICGFAGADTIDAGDGDDIIFGGAGNDEIDAGPGVDVVFGLAGEDRIRGEGGRDSLFGGDDGDILTDDRGPNPNLDGGAGVDLICGSPQRDVIRGGADSDLLRGLGGPDEIAGDAGDDEIFGDAGSNGCPTGLPGTSRRDTLDGGAGEDVIRGGPDRDALRGAGGRDRLFGEADNDSLNACDGARDRVVSGGPGGNDVVKRDNVDPSNGNEVRRPC